MSAFDEFALRIDYHNHSIQKQKLLDSLETVILESKSSLEGNSFYIHNSMNLCKELYAKQLNIFWCGKQAEKKICEIGFNAGHSSMLMLLGRDETPLDVTIFDIGLHPYTKPCLKYIQSQFQHIHFEYIEGDSTVTMPAWIAANTTNLGLYDVIHVDGGHSKHCIYNDMKHADILAKIGGIVIIDDTNMRHINKIVNVYIRSGTYKELDILQTKKYPHRIIQKIM